MIDIQWFPWGLFIPFAGAVIIGYIIAWLLPDDETKRHEVDSI
jgi:phage shock protein PspC (stress-responsive transcriptional regulator)